jgi:hypothetical protein
MRTLIISIILACALIGNITVLTLLYSENVRLADNFSSVAKGTEYYMLNDSLSAARTERLLLDNAEIKQYFPEIQKTVALMDIKLRQLERYSAVSSHANYEIAGRLRDTVKITQTVIEDRIVHDTVKMQYIAYSDKWIDLFVCSSKDTVVTSIQTRDSIVIVQNWTRPHRFLSVRWGRKRYSQTAVNFNPHATVTYSIFVEKK